MNKPERMARTETQVSSIETGPATPGAELKEGISRTLGTAMWEERA